MVNQTVMFYEDMLSADSHMRKMIKDGYKVVTMAASPKNGVMVVYKKIDKKPLERQHGLMDDIKAG